MTIQKSKLKNILFDCDGVMITSPMFSQRYAEKFNVPLENVMQFFNSSDFELCLIGKSDIKREITKYLDKFGWQKSVDELIKYYLNGDEVNHELIEEVEALKKQGIKCYMATNQEKYRNDYLINKLGFGKIFEEIFASCTVGFKKPSKEFFDFVINKLKEDIPELKLQEVLLVDDRQKYVDKAREYGINAELYSDLNSWKEIKNKYA